AAEVGRILREWSRTPGWPDPPTEEVFRAAFATVGVVHSALEYYRWAIRSVPRPDGLRFAHRMRAPIGVPVLQVLGEHDPAMLPSSSAGSERYVTGPYRRELLPAGHFVHEEAPDAFGDLLLGWLRTTVHTAGSPSR
ncbi:MAG: alpha/beta hydrolase, partial [Actinomycetia bacterium]|nr:alpha/beta hydrolase [Actinomycetes bacterium]